MLFRSKITASLDDGTVGSGIGSASIQIDGGTWITEANDTSDTSDQTIAGNLIVPTGSRTTSLTYVLPSALTDGTHTVKISTSDQAGNANTPDSVQFYVDRAVPVIGITTPVDGTIYGTAFGTTGTASGTITEANLVSLTAKLNGNSVAITNGGTTWSSDLDWDHMVEGQLYTLVITAKDIADNTTTASVTFYKDTQGPTIELGNLASNGSTYLTESTPKVLGTISDATGVKTMEYKLDGAGSWTSLGSTGNGKSVSFTLNLGKIGRAHV